MGIFARGTRLWARYKDEKGRRVNERTGYAVGQEDKAQRYLARIVGLARDAREGAKVRRRRRSVRSRSRATSSAGSRNAGGCHWHPGRTTRTGCDITSLPT